MLRLIRAPSLGPMRLAMLMLLRSSTLFTRPLLAMGTLLQVCLGFRPLTPLPLLFSDPCYCTYRTRAVYSIARC